MSEPQPGSPVPASAPANPLSPALLALLCCPICPDRPPLRLTDNSLTCDRCGRVFPIHDGLPDLRPESGVLPGGGSPAPPDAVS